MMAPRCLRNLKNVTSSTQADSNVSKLFLHVCANCADGVFLSATGDKSPNRNKKSKKIPSKINPKYFNPSMSKYP